MIIRKEEIGVNPQIPLPKTWGVCYGKVMGKGPNRFHYGWMILLVGFLGVMGALGFGRFAYTPILPSMKEALSLT